MTGKANKKALEHHGISPKTINRYNESVIGLFFKPDNDLEINRLKLLLT